jgi:cytochrome c biogenesis protein CcmG, thiol:disulfide interchange protein DsbE
MGKLLVRGSVGCALLGAILFVVVLRRGPHPLEVGAKMPEFTLPKADSTDVAVRRGNGHVVVVNFWATWCPPCVMEAPSLEKFAQQVQPLGVRVVGVSVDQSLPDLNKFISSYHLTYPILRDPHQLIASRFGTHLFPETYIFDRDGRLADKVISATDWEDPRMIEFVEALVHWPSAVGNEQKAVGGY